MSYNKQRLCELFKCIYDNTKEGFGDTDSHRRLKVLGGSGTIIQIKSKHRTFTGKMPENGPKTLSIIDDGVDAIDMFVDELLKETEIKEHVSRSGIEKQVSEALQQQFGQIDTDDLESFVKTNILKPVRSNIRTWTVFVPVVNLQIEKELELGDVVFVPKKEVADEVDRFISNGDFLFAGKDEDEIKGNRSVFMGQVQQAINYCHAYAKVKCKSHSSNIQTVSLNKTFVAINTIRAFSHVLYPPSKRALWGLPQEIVFGSSGIISLDYSEKHSFNISYSKNGALIPFVLNIANIEKLQDVCYLEKVQEIFAKSDKQRSCLENVIINSLQAMGRATVAPTTDMRFLGYVMALERLLIKDEEEATTERFVDRLALALTDNTAGRLALVKTAKELYKKRSKMVHAASFFDVFEEDEFAAENWAIGIVIQALCKSIEGYTHIRFCEEINNKKYASG